MFKIIENQDYHLYKILESNIYIGRRPDLGCNLDFFDNIDSILSVTDSFYPFLMHKNSQWLPWKEDTELFPDTVLYGSLKILKYWVIDLKIKNIFLHCDLGTHRAPSVLGAFLDTYFQDTQQNIVNNVETPNKSIYIIDNVLMSNPIEYYKSKVQQNPEIPYISRYIAENPNQNLEDIMKNYRKTLPYNLLNPKEKKDFHRNVKIQNFKEKVFNYLDKHDFNYTKNPQYQEFKTEQDGKPINVWIWPIPYGEATGVFGLDIRNSSIMIFLPKKIKNFNLYELYPEIDNPIYKVSLHKADSLQYFLIEQNN